MPVSIEDLRPDKGARKTRRRVGRGHGSGRVKTAGRGTKGQNSRSGGGVRAGFEGGQLPIQRRMPRKRGFTNRLKTPWELVNLSTLDGLEIEGDVTPEALVDAGVVRSLELPVKILGNGELTKRVDVKAHAFSASAKAAIEQAGGSVETLDRDDHWLTARPRSRRLPINRQLKQMRVGKVGGPSRREALAELREQEAKEA